MPNELKDSSKKIDIIKKYILHTKTFKGIFAGFISITLGYFNVPLFKKELEQFLLGNYFPLPTLIITVALINNFNFKNDLLIIKRRLSGDSTIWLELILIILAVVILIALTINQVLLMELK